MYSETGSSTKDTLLQLKMSAEENALLGTTANGFIIWLMGTDIDCSCDNAVEYLKLPHGVRNISATMTRSNSCMLSRDKSYLVAGVR